MVSTAPARRRVATPQRWQTALQRAVENGVTVYQVANSGAWVATSKSTPGTVYETDGVECGCLAWVNGDPVCQHRAAYFAAIGMLDLDTDPEPTDPAPAVAVSPYRCQTCEDTGAVTVENRLRPGLTFRKPCSACRSSIPTTTFLARTQEGEQPSTTRPCRACDRTGTALDDAGKFVDCHDCTGTGVVPCAVPSPELAALPIAS